MKITFSQNCAWRALYVYRDLRDDDDNDVGAPHQIFRLGIDPTFPGRGPRLFGAVTNPWNRRGWSWKFNIRLPRVPWRYYNSLGPVSRLAYRWSSQFWSSLDGRRFR